MNAEGRIEGKFAVLEPLSPSHYPALYSLVNRPDLSYRWRGHGRVVGPEEFEDQLWRGVLAQFALRARSGDVDGFTVVYNHSPDHGFAYFAQITAPPNGIRRRAIEGAALTFEYAFVNFSIRKLYLEVPGFNLSQFARAVGFVFKEEGVLQDHFYYDRRYWPLHILSLSRDHWTTVRGHFLPSGNETQNPSTDY